MRRIKLGLGLMAALVFSSAVAASASAASFLSSAKEKLLFANVAKQVFKTEAGTVECSKATITAGESAGAEATQQSATVKYENCTAFGLATATISPVEYVLSAYGEVYISKLVNITTTGCEVDVPVQSVNGINYATKGNNILLEPSVTGFEYAASGSACLKTGTFRNGTYAGHSEVMIPSGTLSFMSTGGGEKQNVSLTPIECVENIDKEVLFTTLKETCEYQLKNNNAMEVVVFEEIRVGLFPECEKITCLIKVAPGLGKACTEVPKTRLAVGASCNLAVEYNKKPPKEEQTKIIVKTESVGGGVVERPERFLTVK